MNDISIALASTFTIEPLSQPLKRWLKFLGRPGKLIFVPYGQLLMHLVDAHSPLHRHEEGFNVLLVRPSDFIRTSSNATQISPALNEFCKNLETTSRHWRAQTLVILVPPQPQVASTLPEKEWQDINDSLNDRLSAMAGFEVLSAQTIFDSYQCHSPIDTYAEQTAHIPWNDSAWLAIAAAISRHIDRHLRSPLKAVIVDCDNTLWHGVCAEDGPLGVKVEARHAYLQHLLLQQRQQGRLICLCSKNSPEDVWSVFESNKEMVLSREHLTAAMINWSPKSSNIIQLAKSLHLATDSFLFLDDNPLEIGEVQAHLPDVISIGLPSAPNVSWEKLLANLWPLDGKSQTPEDLKRVQMYAEESQREALRSQSNSLSEFLMSLEIEVDIQALDTHDQVRAEQLLQRTNQFNIRPSIRGMSQLHDIAIHHKLEACTVRARDRLGDYGLVGLMLFHCAAGKMYLDQFVLSCRALGRTVEVRMLQYLAQLAEQRGIQNLEIPFEATQRNQPAYAFLCKIANIPAAPEPISSAFLLNSQSLLAVNPYSLDLKSSETMVHSAMDTSQSSVERQPANPYQKISELFTVELMEGFHRAHFSRQFQRSDSVELPHTNLDRQICGLCQEVLYLDQIGMSDSFRDLGCSSLQFVRICSKIQSRFHISIPIAETFALATVRDLSQLVQYRLSRQSAVDSAFGSRHEPVQFGRETFSLPPERNGHEIAIIGMAGRFPGADDVLSFWQNLIQGVESIETLTDAELNLPATSPLRNHPNLVKRAAYIKNADHFDARFFGVFPKEAAAMDPQHRLLLEECYHALEDAGYIPDQIEDPVGIFAGCYMDTYVLSCLESHPEWIQGLANSFHGGDLLTELGNDKDYLATRISFLLNLRGPALTIQTACSTSLVAIIQACQSLLSNQCKMALAGGVTLKFPQKRGYLYTEGGMVSPEGKCRTFDAKAKGTIFGEGVAVVVLKRLEHALQDGDPIYAVLKGWGMNNDGRSKSGYTAPSISGQMEAITLAHQHARITADSLQYVEAHGTGTSLGDPIEIEALTRAFRRTTSAKQFCRIGSAKTNIGHLDVAAGACGLIKTSLALKYEQIPPSLNFESPNPNIDFANSPFVVNTQCTHWPRSEQPRRAGLSSFGVGGTNAHVIIEESPPLPILNTARSQHLLTLSARSEVGLSRIKQRLLDWLKSNPDSSIADTCFTLSAGRKKFNHTWSALVTSTQEAINLLGGPASNVNQSHSNRRNVPVVFAFPGQGSQCIDMGYELYRHEPEFAKAFDQCEHLLEPLLNFRLKEKLFTAERRAGDDIILDIQQTVVAQPAIFAVSYATARWLQSLGVSPVAMIGHSVGEFVAACLCGVFQLDDALKIVAYRAKCMQRVEPGQMLAVRLSEEGLLGSNTYKKYSNRVSLAAVNAPQLVVLSGETSIIANLQQELELEGIVSKVLKTSHAFHSWMMDSVVEPLAAEIRKLKLSRPTTKILSTVTGRWLRDEEAISADYWAKHLRETVRFSRGAEALLESDFPLIVEVGPGQTLSTLLRQHKAAVTKAIFSIFPHPQQEVSLHKHALETLGKIWQTGAEIQLAKLYAYEKRQRLNLPGYPFDRQRFWFDQLVQPTSWLSPQSPLAVSSLPAVSSELAEDRSLADSGIQKKVDGVGASDNAAADHTTFTQNDEYSSLVQQVIRQQLEIMTQQLKLWNL